MQRCSRDTHPEAYTTEYTLVCEDKRSHGQIGGPREAGRYNLSVALLGDRMGDDRAFFGESLSVWDVTPHHPK